TLSSNLTEYSAFAQDTWRMHPRLTATFGLRWEYSRSPDLRAPEDLSAPPIAYTFDGQTSIWTENQKNFAPRVGIAFQPTGDGKTVLRGGWGRFFDSTLSIATDLVNGGPLSVSQFLTNKGELVNRRLTFGFLPDLRLPKVDQWNVTLERRTATNDVLSVAYVGSSGTDLLRREFGGFEGSQTLWLALATNHGEADYHGLQVQYRRPMSRGLQALASYSWAHSIDNSSSDSVLHRVGDGVSAQLDRGPSDFDVRQALTFSLTYERERKPGPALTNRLFGGWGVDAIFRARTGFPVAVLNSEYSMGLGFSNAFRPNLAPGQPIWLTDSASPGGRRLNRAAFAPTTGDVQGNLGRNAVRGFGMHQTDLAVRRRFQFSEQRALELRIEAFNLFNHPNFADPTRFLSSPLFGQSPSMLNLMLGTGSPGSGLTPIFQSGGARSVQLILRFRF
ncbi:MAG: TonB-dependent receptor, partial [bacterium]|nr:TonB-dependent receptor [bacterium]